jgi:drug/metabolite transporter (DMT)-like permease
MGYLFLAILASFSISLLIKDNETRGMETEVILASNYLTASAVGWLFVLLDARGPNPAFQVSRETLLLGLGGSLLWPGAFYLQMWGIRRYGMSLAGSVARLSLSVPVLFALVFLGERFTPLTALGIGGAFAAFLLLSPFHAERTGAQTGALELDRNALWYFPTLLLIFGCVDLWANLHTNWAPSGERFLFMVMIFTGAGLLAWAAALLRRRPIDRASVIHGLILGVPNFFSTYFLMESLRAPGLQGHSAIVYAVYSAMGVVLAFLAGWLLWREVLTGRNRVGVALAVAAVVLLNVR